MKMASQEMKKVWGGKPLSGEMKLASQKIKVSQGIITLPWEM